MQAVSGAKATPTATVVVVFRKVLLFVSRHVANYHSLCQLGDGYCDGGLYNELDACFEDGTDCAFFNKQYPNCFVPSPEKIGDGFCDGSVYFVEECGNDGGDCEGCDVEHHWWIADGFCGE